MGSLPDASFLGRLLALLGGPLDDCDLMVQPVTGRPRPRARSRPVPVPAALAQVVAGHEPFLACAVDAEWNLLAANPMLEMLIGPVAPHLLTPPINVLRLVLHPDGVAPRLANLDEVHEHLLRRLRRRIARAGNAVLGELERELVGYRPGAAIAETVDGGPIVTPVRLWSGPRLFNLIGTGVYFGTPWDPNAPEVTGEFLLPADEATRQMLFTWPDGAQPPDDGEKRPIRR